MRWFVNILLVVWTVSTTLAADWPQWLGPNRDGTSADTVSPWKDAPRVIWRQPVGEGHSSPIVAKGFVFMIDRVPGENAERLSCWNADTGKKISSIQYERSPFSNPFGAGPRSTPIYDDGNVYALGVTARLSKSAVGADGQLTAIFNNDLLKEFNAKNLFFGVAQSMLLVDDKILTMVGGKGAGIVALSKKDGSTIWKTLDDTSSYASPILIESAGRQQAVFLTHNGLVGLSPKNGEVFWTFPFQDKLSESSTTPVKIGEHLLASSVTLGSVLLKLTSKEGKPAVEKVWDNADLSCYFSTPAPVGEHVYMITAGGNLLQPKLMLRCVEWKTGKTVWSKEDAGRYHAAILRTANGKLLILDDRGFLALVEPDPKEYRELARAKICGQTWAHPALVHGRLYIRDDQELLCLELPN